MRSVRAGSWTLNTCGNRRAPHAGDLDYIGRMKSLATAIALALLLAACSKVTQENYAKIQDGMSEPEVIGLLGPATESGGMSLLGLSGGSSKWVAKDAVISIQFVNGKVVGKSFRQEAAK